MTNGIMNCNWSMNDNDSGIYWHVATVYTKGNWFVIPFSCWHFLDWVTKISEFSLLKKAHNSEQIILQDCDNLENYFNVKGGGPRNPKNPFSCVCLHGDRKPAERKANLESFKVISSTLLILNIFYSIRLITFWGQ